MSIDVRDQVMGMHSAMRRRITIDFENATDANADLEQVRRLVYRADDLIDLALRILDGEAPAPTDEQFDALNVGMWAVGLEDAPSGRSTARVLQMLADPPEGVR